MKSPAAFYSGETTLWVMDDIVAVLNAEHAHHIFSYVHNFRNMKVYGIKGTTANLLGSYYDAIEFFKEPE